MEQKTPKNRFKIKVKKKKMSQEKTNPPRNHYNTE